MSTLAIEQHQRTRSAMGEPRLGELTPAAFLHSHWQKRPLIVRQAFPELITKVSADTLAGLALEEGIESRVIKEDPIGEWHLCHGPFEEAFFAALPARNWTLLVQAVDHYLPELADVLDAFRFIPNWRIDDIMMSYAVPGGNVGPHMDYYDVFLIQGEGSREWRIAPPPSEPYKSDTSASTGLRLLPDMPEGETWTLHPGDMLYLPPQFAHHGIALDTCTTYSVGFRAPSHSDLLQDCAAALAAQLMESDRYQDPDLPHLPNPGLLPESAIDKVMSILGELSQDRERVKQWFAGYMSAPKYPEEAFESPSTPSFSEFKEALHQPGATLSRDESSRWLFTEKNGAIEHVFINGERVRTPDASDTLIRELCSRRRIPVTTVDEAIAQPDIQQWLYELLQSGCLYLNNQRPSSDFPDDIEELPQQERDDF